MTLSFACPKCGKTYRNVKQQLIGKKARCSCGKVIRIGNSDRSASIRDFLENDRTSESESQNSVAERAAAQNDGAAGESRLSRDEKKRVPTVDVRINKRLVIKDHYDDLDALLAGNVYEDISELADVPNREVGIPAGLVSKPPAENPAARSSLALIAAIASATMAFWFGLLVVLLRFTEFDNLLLNYFQQTHASINSASFGDDELTTGLKLGFIVMGWSMWVAGLAMVLLAVVQLLNALVQLFIQRQWLRWADGLMATLSIIFVFLVVGSLFLHASQMTKLNRELNKIVPVATADEFVPPNVQRIREQYNQRNRTFTIVMLVSGAVPLTIFAFSMVRLFTTAGSANRE